MRTTTEIKKDRILLTPEHIDRPKAGRLSKRNISQAFQRKTTEVDGPVVGTCISSSAKRVNLDNGFSGLSFLLVKLNTGGCRT